jgi:hypothetical protein
VSHLLGKCLLSGCVHIFRTNVVARKKENVTRVQVRGLASIELARGPDEGVSSMS